MKYIFIYFFLLLGACKEKHAPQIFILSTDPNLQNKNGVWYYKKQRFNGYIQEKKGNNLTATLPVQNGKENGIAYGWYETGEKKYLRNFKNGNREGIHQIWYKNGRLSAEFFYVKDKLEGEQNSYFESGHTWQSLHYKNGYEEGKQKTWNDSGRVINNFTVKNGKLYGVIGRYDCVSVMQ